MRRVTFSSIQIIKIKKISPGRFFKNFLIVYSRIRSGYALRGTPNKSPALRLALLLVVELGFASSHLTRPDK